MKNLSVQSRSLSAVEDVVLIKHQIHETVYMRPDSYDFVSIQGILYWGIVGKWERLTFMQSVKGQHRIPLKGFSL